MVRYLLVGTLLLGVGIFLGLAWQSPPDLPAPQPAASSRANPPDAAGTRNTVSLADLGERLLQEQQARLDLEIRLDELQARLEQLEESGDVTPADTAPQNVAGKTSIQGLIDAGISRDQAEWIQGRLDDIELQQLYLADRASREGWINQARYHKERAQFRNAVADLRGEIGDDAYDRLLFALGRMNRVVVRDVLQTSAAAVYGLKRGDIILEYAGQRVFTPAELSNQIKQSSAGVLTLLRVERAGVIEDIYLPSGPLGIRMNSVRMAP